MFMTFWRSNLREMRSWSWIHTKNYRIRYSTCSQMVSVARDECLTRYPFTKIVQVDHPAMKDNLKYTKAWKLLQFFAAGHSSSPLCCHKDIWLRWNYQLLEIYICQAASNDARGIQTTKPLRMAGRVVHDIIWRLEEHSTSHRGTA